MNRTMITQWSSEAQIQYGPFTFFWTSSRMQMVMRGRNMDVFRFTAFHKTTIKINSTLLFSRTSFLLLGAGTTQMVNINMTKIILSAGYAGIKYKSHQWTKYNQQLTWMVNKQTRALMLFFPNGRFIGGR